jgi:predicted metal-dependent hydrolase
VQTAPTTIIRRRVDIDFAPVPAGPWFPAGGPLEILFNAASLSFPPTERFFIGAVRDYLDQMSDPALREQVTGFIHQEAMHNRVHIDGGRRNRPTCARSPRRHATATCPRSPVARPRGSERRNHRGKRPRRRNVMMLMRSARRQLG